ncbi:MAG: hypothetical protein GY838_17210 [bacterium]|nr:hypothetical protein [bacterium]
MRPFIRPFALSVFLVLALFALASCGDDDDGTKPKPAATYTLYFSQDSNGNGLYSIDIATGVGTIVGDGISGVTSSTIGLAYNSAGDGILLGSKYSTLLAINLDGSGAVDLGGIGHEALAYDNDAEILYGCLNSDFRTINPATGLAIATLTDSVRDVEGLAVETDTGNVFGLASGSPATLMLYNPTDGTWTTIGDTGFNMDSVALAYHPTTKVLYAIDGNSASLYTMDQATGAATLVGAHGIAGSGGGGLAFAKD